MKTFLAACLVVAMPSIAKAEDWSSFRGPEGNGVDIGE